MVSGSTGAHDPSIVKRPTGGYLLATTGAGITLKTSSDRAAFPNLLGWDSSAWPYVY